jgi:hypothetical protein
MSYWHLGNEIEQLSYRISSIKSIIEMVAERVIENPESSALWGCAEMIEVYEQQLIELSEYAMDMNRQVKLENTKKKGKDK